MKMLDQVFRKDLVAIAKADKFADAEEVAKFVAEMEEAGLYGNPTEDEIERFTEII